MNEFKIRAYGRMELAQLYSPELTDIAAYRKMKKWISLCPGLLQRLYDLGYVQIDFHIGLKLSCLDMHSGISAPLNELVI